MDLQNEKLISLDGLSTFYKKFRLPIGAVKAGDNVSINNINGETTISANVVAPYTFEVDDSGNLIAYFTDEVTDEEAKESAFINEEGQLILVV